MSTRVYIYTQTDNQVEELAKKLEISKSDVIMLAVNNYYRARIHKSGGKEA